MKILLIAAFIFLAGEPKEYPLHVRIEDTHWHTGNGYASGWGQGNVTDGSDTSGFDFTFEDCSHPFLASHAPNDFYPGRWKDSPHKITIATSEIGSDKKSECTLKVSLKSYVYYRKDGQIHTRPK